MQSFSFTYAVSAAQSLLENKIVQTLAKTAPDLDVSAGLAAGAANISDTLSGADLVAIRQACMSGLKDCFALGIAAAGLLIVVTMAALFRRLLLSEEMKESSHDDIAATETGDDADQKSKEPASQEIRIQYDWKGRFSG